MPNPDTVYIQLRGAICAFVSDPNNQEMAALEEERKRLAKEIRNMHLTYATNGDIEAIPEDQRQVLKEKQKQLTEKDDKYWNVIKDNAGVLFGQKPCTVEQLSLQMNHTEELGNEQLPQKTNWNLKSPYSQKEQLERAKVRNDLLKKVFTEQIDRIRSAEQQERLSAQMWLNTLEDQYFFGAAYSTKPGEHDPDKAHALESFSNLEKATKKMLSQTEREAYTQEFYNVYRKTFNQIHEKQIDLELFSDLTRWKNPNGTWNDKMLVENYETISLLNKIGTASASMNEAAAGREISPDKECERFCRTYDPQLSLASALMERLNYIQNPYYDEIDLDDPQMKQSFSPAISSPSERALNDDIKNMAERDINDVLERQHAYKAYINTKKNLLTDLYPVSEPDSKSIVDLFYSWTRSQYQGFKQNIRAMANVMRAQGSDLSQLRMRTDFEYYQAKLRDEKDFSEGKIKDEEHWRKRAGLKLQALAASSDGPTGDTIFASYWLVMNTPSEYVTFTSLDGEAREMKIPVSVMLNPDFATDLNQRLSPKNKKPSVLPREPAKGANAKEKEKYEYEKTLCDMEKLYHGVLKEKKENFVQQGEKLELFPNSLKDLLKTKDDSVHAIIQKHSKYEEDIKLTDDSAPDKSKTIEFPLPELCLRRVVYAHDVSEIKTNGHVTIKVTPKDAEKAINEAKLRIIEAVNLSNNGIKNEAKRLSVNEFIETYGENSVTKAEEILGKRQRKDPEREKKEQEQKIKEQKEKEGYAELLNISVAQFDELKAENDKLAKTEQSVKRVFENLTFPVSTLLDYSQTEDYTAKVPFFLDGLKDLQKRVEEGGTLVGKENDLLPLWKKVKDYADREISTSDKDCIRAKEKYDEKCREIYGDRSNNCYLRYLLKLAKEREQPTSTLDLIAEADRKFAMLYAGEKFHLTPDEIEASYQNCKIDNHMRPTSRTSRVKDYWGKINNWEQENGVEEDHIIELLKKDPDLKVSTAKAMVMNSKHMSTIKSYAKKLGVPADAMLKGLAERQRDFPRYTAKFFYEDTKQDLDTAFKTFGMTQKEFFKYCQETNNDPLAFAKKASTGDMQLAFSAALEEYGMSGKEFLEYCQETERDPFVLAQRTAAESLGEYKVLQQPKEEEVPKNIQNEENPKNIQNEENPKNIRNEEEPWNIQNEAVPKNVQKKWAVPSDALQAESDALEAKQKYEIDLEKKIKKQLSVDVFSDEMVANLKKLSAAAENDAKSLRGKVKKDSAAEVLLIRGKRFYNDVIAEVETKAATGDKMSTAMENIAPLYMLTAHELLKEELKGKGKGTGIADYLSRFKGEDKAKGLNNLVATMAKIEVIKEPLNNMSAYDLWHSLINGTFMKNLGIGAVQKLNNTLRQEAQPKPAGKQLIDENQVVQGNAPML